MSMLSKLRTYVRREATLDFIVLTTIIMGLALVMWLMIESDIVALIAEFLTGG